MLTRSERLAPILLEAVSYREFLKRAFSILKTENPQFGYSSFCRLAGIKARSFPRDVILGKKNLSQLSAQKFAKALNLQGELANYFRFLVAKENPQAFLVTSAEAEKNLNRLKGRLKQQNQNIASEEDQRIFKSELWPQVYASLGMPEEGEELKTISERSGLSVSTCRRILGELTRKKLITYHSRTKKYSAKKNHLFFAELGKQKAFQKFFLHSLKLALRSAKKDFSKEDRLFFTSCVSVDKKRMPEFKLALRHLLNRFADKIESPQGEYLVSLSCSLVPFET